MSFAYNTPIQFLPGIGWRTAGVLHELGVHTAGQLSRVPDQMLIELFGPSIRSVLKFIEVKPVSVTNAGSIFTATREDVPQRTEKKSLLQRLRLAAQFVSVL